MTTEHLACLDAIASKAAGKPCRVYLDEEFPLHLRGLADYDGHHYVIRLNPALLTWMRDELEATFYHECAHIKLNHVDTGGSLAQRKTAYIKIINHKPQTYNDAYYTVGAQVREIAVEQEAARLRCQWPFAAYRLWKLITGKEVFR